MTIDLILKMSASFIWMFIALSIVSCISIEIVSVLLGRTVVGMSTEI